MSKPTFTVNLSHAEVRALRQAILSAVGPRPGFSLKEDEVHTLERVYCVVLNSKEMRRAELPSRKAPKPKAKR